MAALTPVQLHLQFLACDKTIFSAQSPYTVDKDPLSICAFVPWQ